MVPSPGNRRPAEVRPGGQRVDVVEGHALRVVDAEAQEAGALFDSASSKARAPPSTLAPAAARWGSRASA